MGSNLCKKDQNVNFKAENNPLTSARRSLMLVATISVLTLLGLFGASKANATEYQFGDYTMYTTSSFCSIVASPPTGTLNANGTQTFTFTIGSSGLANELFYGDVPGPPKPGADPVEVPPVTKLDVWNGCMLGDIAQLAGVNVKMEVLSGPDAGLVLEALLQADGTVTFPLVNNGVVGTDQVRFTIVLPELCLMYRDFGDDYIEYELLEDAACEESLNPSIPDDTRALRAAPGARPLNGALSVTMTTNAAVTWIAPPPVAASSAVSVTSFKSCVANRIRIRPSYSSGLRSAKLVVDGKTVQTKTSTSAFILNPSKYKAGKHRFKVVATYDSGTVTSNTGTFSKCKAKVSVKKVKPKFTG